MEDDLDEIAGGRQQRVPWLHQFWFGNGTPGVKGLKDKALEEADAEAINTIPLGVDDERRADRRPQRPLRALPASGARTPRRSPTTCRSTSSPSTGPSRSCSAPEGRRAARRRSRRPGCRCSPRAAASVPTCSSATPTPCRPTRSRRCRRCSRRCRCRRSPLEEALQLLPPAAHRSAPHPERRRGDHRRQRPLRPVPEVGRGDPQPRHRGAAAHGHRSTRR